jgi:hypothetical protein
MWINEPGGQLRRGLSSRDLGAMYQEVFEDKSALAGGQCAATVLARNVLIENGLRPRVHTLYSILRLAVRTAKRSGRQLRHEREYRPNMTN